MQYTIIDHYKELEFIKKINLYLADGWELQGGICKTFDNGNNPHWVQAMIKNRLIDSLISER